MNKTNKKILEEWRKKFLNPDPFSSIQLHPDYQNKGTLMVDMEQFLDSALTKARQETVVEMIAFLEVNGHGGGNWRRLISQLQAKYLSENKESGVTK